MSGGPGSGARTVRCPGCGGASVYAPANAWRPFCSVRCRESDLGAWAAESYRMPELTPPDTGTPGSLGEPGSEPAPGHA